MTDAPSDPKSGIVAMPLDEARRARGDVKVALPRSKVAGLRAFRRIRADRLFGTLGAVLLVAGLILAFTWPQPPVKPEPKYKVDWVESLSGTETKANAHLGFQSGPANPSANTDCHTTPASCPKAVYTEKADLANVTKIVFWLTWTDDVADPNRGLSEGDTFALSFEGPGFPAPNPPPSRTGGKLGENISFTLAMSGIPDLGSVPAKNEAEAWKALNENPNATANKTGMGDWKFTVILLKAAPHWNDENAAQHADQVPCAGTTPTAACTPDYGNDYTFHWEYYTYAPKLSKLA